MDSLFSIKCKFLFISNIEREAGSGFNPDRGLLIKKCIEEAEEIMKLQNLNIKTVDTFAMELISGVGTH